MKRLGIVVGILVVALVASVTVRATAFESEDPLVIVHWSNSHPMREGLLPAMAEAFNDDDHETASGQPIEVVVVPCDSSDQIDDLVTRAQGAARGNGCADEDGAPASDPAIVTPQSDDWLVELNHRAGREVVDLGKMETIAETYLGIVTYRAMAECLGWPERELGYADLIALHAQPTGWRTHPECYRSEWGQDPLLAFTNPNTSTSGRNVLVSLYSIAAGAAPEDLTIEDLQRSTVVDYVEDFQQMVDHYMPGTMAVNRRIAQGEDAGHFFLMPEDNLVSLYKGNEKYTDFDGTEQDLDPVKELVMVYPEEGSVLNSNPAGIVEADWVSGDEADAAGEWIDFLREEDQQRAFMGAGFRPAAHTGQTIDEQQFVKWGLDPEQPTQTIEPGALAPDVLDHIIASWGAVKKPSIVTFVVDVSGSMEGEPLEQVKEGMGRLIDEMSDEDSASEDTQVGLVTFGGEIQEEIRPAPLLTDAQFSVPEVVSDMEATGSTALYDAVERAVELTDGAEGAPGATRAVVVLSDGAATAGETCLDDLVEMRASSEASIASFCGKREDDGVTPADQPIDETGEEVPVEEVDGVALQGTYENDVQVFFLGFGEADYEIGRILAEATGTEPQGSADEDLAAVIEALSGYF